MYVPNISSVSNICCKYFHLDVAKVDLDITYVCNGFQVFLGIFFKCFRRMFQVFHLCSLYVATVASGCFKSRSGVAHGMRVGSG